MKNGENGGFAWEDTTVVKYICEKTWRVLILWDERVYLLRAHRITAAIEIKQIPEPLFAASLTTTATIDEYFFCYLPRGEWKPQQLILFAAGRLKTTVIDVIFFFKLFFLFIVAYIKNRSEWLAANTFFPTSVLKDSQDPDKQNYEFYESKVYSNYKSRLFNSTQGCIFPMPMPLVFIGKSNLDFQSPINVGELVKSTIYLIPNYINNQLNHIATTGGITC